MAAGECPVGANGDNPTEPGSANGQAVGVDRLRKQLEGRHDNQNATSTQPTRDLSAAAGLARSTRADQGRPTAVSQFDDRRGGSVGLVLPQRGRDGCGGHVYAARCEDPVSATRPR
ncbi:hypothetical protein GCM10022255_107930 [Dactylosporangium darangshiense]|uniref:Uncharacterized protein n=1 Tax=Dactylosporangium darangshiense TaxID=579108 RepID=A0ABP8DTZ4_9ACTN